MTKRSKSGMISNKREMMRAWRRGYQSTGTARRMVFRYLQGIGCQFDDFPTPKELVKVLEQKFHLTFDERFWTNNSKIIFFAEILADVPHTAPEHHKLKDKASISRHRAKSEKFLSSDKWYALRKIVLDQYGHKCMRCGSTA